MNSRLPFLKENLKTAIKRAVAKTVGSVYVSIVECLWRVDLDQMFDRAGYLAKYPEIARAGLDPVFHYLWSGAREGRQPHPDFDTKYYVRRYPDVAASKLNPLVHYLRIGRKQSRLANQRGRSIAPGSPATFDEIVRFGIGRVVFIPSEDGQPTDLIWALDGDPVKVGSEACLTGWCFLQDFSAPAAIMLSFGGKSVLGFTMQERPDVAAALRNPSLSQSGFIVRMPLSDRAATAVLSAEVHGRTVRLAKVRLPRRTPEGSRQTRIKTYKDWIGAFENNKGGVQLLGLAPAPLISVLMPTHNSNLYFLSRAIESITRQSYRNWELVIADDASTAAGVVEYLQSMAASNPKVKLVLMKNSGHISAATNVALRAAKGDYVVLLDHDDELHPDALSLLSKAIGANPAVVLLYSDEDKFDRFGRRIDPSFKPGFDLDLLRETDYIGHIVSIKRDAALSVGGCRDECVGAQDWDLLLRLAEQIRPEQVVHLTSPLYHWRQHDSSTAQSIDAKPYARRAWRRAVGDHVQRCGLQAGVEPGLVDGCLRLHFRPPSDASITVLLADEASLRSRATLLSAARCVSKLAFRSLASGGDVPPVSADDLGADILVYLCGGIDSVNHKIFEELSGQALRPDCWYVGGVALSRDLRVFEAGYYQAGERQLVNPFLGAPAEAPGYMRLLKSPHRVAIASTRCFAVKAGLARKCGGIEFLRQTHPVDAAVRMALKAASEGLPPLFTPYAVLTGCEEFSADEASATCLRVNQAICDSGYLGRVRLPSINPNLLAFDDLRAVFAKGLE